MTIDIQVHSQFTSRVRRAELERIARKALRAERTSASLTIYVTGDAEIRKFNRQFHATNAPTDVLSFPANANGHSLEHPYLGDIVISYERASVQARQAGWRIVDELNLLAVHGILHLLGYDDLTPGKRAKMWKRQEEILGRKIK